MKDPIIHSIYVDPNEFEVFIKETNQYEQYVSDLFAHSKLYQLTYETLVDSFSPCMSNIQNFIGLDSLELRPRTKKQSDNNLSNYIENYDDLIIHFRNTKYICFFE